MAAQPGGAERWRTGLRRELTWLVLLKIAALALLWWLFFSPVHRTGVDGHAAGQHFGLEERAHD
jgi:hypothetical protein